MKKNYFETGLTVFFLGWMFLVFPLFSKGNYFNITESKWQMLFCVTLLFIVLWTCSRVTDGKWLLRNPYQRNFDVFGLLIIVSTIFSPYPANAWTGGGARYTGALFMLLMLVVMMYIGSTNLHRYVSLLMQIFITGGILVSVWAVLNFLGIDIFRMHEGMVQSQVRSYMSGIGNIVFMGSFYATYLPVAFVCFMDAQEKKELLFYGCGILFGGMGLLVSGTDSGLIGVLLVLFGIIPAFLKGNKQLLRFAQSSFVFMISGIAVEWMGRFSAYGDDAFDNVLTLVNGLHGFEAGLLVCALLIAVLMLMKESFWLFPAKLVYYVVLIAGIAWCVMTQELFRSLLIFGDNWGTGRGDVWIKAFQIFQREPLFRKLFGNGADTFAKLLIEYMGTNLGANGQQFDNVHCEYLQYLLSFGVAGLGMYLYMIGCILKGLLKKGAEPYCMAVAAGIAGYLIQAAAGLNQVFTTPLFFLLCGIGVSLVRPEPVLEEGKKRRKRKNKAAVRK